MSIFAIYVVFVDVVVVVVFILTCVISSKPESTISAIAFFSRIALKLQQEVRECF